MILKEFGGLGKRGRGKAPLREKEENKIWSLKFRERKTKRKRNVLGLKHLYTPLRESTVMPLS